MKRLTAEAKAYCQEALEAMGRETIIDMLENQAGCACYDDEDTDSLAESAVDSVEAGDIEFDWGFAQAKSLGHHVYMTWLDIDEVWS